MMAPSQTSQLTDHRDRYGRLKFAGGGTPPEKKPVMKIPAGYFIDHFGHVHLTSAPRLFRRD